MFARGFIVAVTALAVAGAVVLYVRHPTVRVSQDRGLAGTTSRDIGGERGSAELPVTVAARPDDGTSPLATPEQARRADLSAGTPHGDAHNLWGMVSDDGTTFQLKSAARALDSDDVYKEILDGLSSNADSHQQQRIAEIISGQATALGTNASIYEMACSSRMCVGSLVLQSDEIARDLARRLSESRETSGIHRIMVESDFSSSGLRKFLVVTDPAMQRTVVSVGSDFSPPNHPQQEDVDALGKALMEKKSLKR